MECEIAGNIVKNWEIRHIGYNDKWTLAGTRRSEVGRLVVVAVGRDVQKVGACQTRDVRRRRRNERALLPAKFIESSGVVRRELKLGVFLGSEQETGNKSWSRLEAGSNWSYHFDSLELKWTTYPHDLKRFPCSIIKKRPHFSWMIGCKIPAK